MFLETYITQEVYRVGGSVVFEGNYAETMEIMDANIYNKVIMMSELDN
jgi:hypothetical protein